MRAAITFSLPRATWYSFPRSQGPAPESGPGEENSRSNLKLRDYTMCRLNHILTTGPPMVMLRRGSGDVSAKRGEVRREQNTRTGTSAQCVCVCGSNTPLQNNSESGTIVRAFVWGGGDLLRTKTWFWITGDLSAPYLWPHCFLKENPSHQRMSLCCCISDVEISFGPSLLYQMIISVTPWFPLLTDQLIN